MTNGIDLTLEQVERLLRLLGRLERVEELEELEERALEIEDALLVPSSITDSERQQYEAAKQWMGDFIVAVRGYLSSDLAEGGELAAMKEEMRSRVMNMLARGRPW